MAKILRKTQKIFCENAATDQTAVFGTMKNIPGGGSATYSKDIETLQSDAAFLLGFSAAVVNGYAPFMEELNAILYAVTYQMSYILQNGIPEWDDGTTYYIDSIVVGSNSQIYRCLTDDCINIDPTTDDGTNWYDFALYGANQDLSNLTELGENRLHALKGYLDEGEALTDTTLYNDVHSYANSTFDISKFTIIGTPKITADGIASNLSTSNYLTAIPSSMYYNKSNWHLQFKGKFDPTITCGFMDFDNDEYAYLAYMDGWHSITLQLYDVNNEQIFISIEYANDKFVKGDILFDIYYSSTSGYYFTATQNGTTYTSSTSSNTNQLKNASTQPLLYIHSTNTSSIDLKAIKFFVDNQPVFDGNISGVDTVYTDNYAVVGSPTISSNGVASGFSATSYLTHTMNFSGSGFKARIPFKVTATNATQELFYNTNLQFRLIYVSASTAVYPSIYLTDGVHTTQPRTSTYKIVANTNYIVEYEFIQGTSVSIKLYAADGVTLLDSSTNTSADTKAVVLPNTNLTTYIGTTNTGTNVFSGSIDLAGTRIETNTEVYRPFLQIPYVLSSTGSKIVDSAYRDRVIDLYEQEGKARYYTIDYTNKNATLPMGEVYGLIESEIVDNPDKVQSANLINVNATDVVEPSVYEKLEKDYHSSFDVSKFTKVGSPVITDDGIASGFSSSNYLTLSSIPMNTNWKVEYAFHYVNNASAQVSLAIINASTSKHVLRLWYRGNSNEAQIVPYYSNGDSFEAIPFNLVNNTNYKYIIWNDGTDINYQVINTDNNTIVSSGKKTGYDYTLGSINANVVIGVNNSHSEAFQGQLDLKQFSITVDGYPVFNGNKTGVDTIKADDYTVVGTPTITSDGVASGFSNSNYLTTQTIDFSASSWTVIISFRTSSTITSGFLLGSDSSNNIFSVATTSAKYLKVNLGSSSSSSDIISYTGTTLSINTNYFVRISKNNTTYTVELSTNLQNWTTLQTTTSALSVPNVTFTIGNTFAHNVAFTGSIDLNSFQVYVNGNLVYQPCLKVPYTFSKDGKKIVDAIYQDRVIDVYNQYGSALYTVINKDKKTYNLPMGSMQGFIANRQVIGDWCITVPTTVSSATLNRPCVVIENYVNGKDGYRIWSDGFIEQWGYKATTVNAQQEYTLSLLKTFSDTDYFFTRTPDWKVEPSGTISSFYDNGYTSKSTTQVVFKMHESSMQNGTDWYACGY